MNNPNVLKWLQENFQRFTTKAPKFFKVWQLISGALVIITGVPELLSQLGIDLPNLWSDRLNTIIGWASSGILFMSLLTTQSKPVGVTVEGEVIKQTDPKLLPFTAAVEQKIADKTEVKKIEILPAITHEK